MDVARDPSPVGDAAAERQALLPSALLADRHPGGHDADGVDSATNTETRSMILGPGSRAKLGASALNFFLSGIAMAAVGVNITVLSCVTTAY